MHIIFLERLCINFVTVVGQSETVQKSMYETRKHMVLVHKVS